MIQRDIWYDVPFFNEVLHAQPTNVYVEALRLGHGAAHTRHEWPDGRLPNGWIKLNTAPCSKVVLFLAQIGTIKKYVEEHP